MANAAALNKDSQEKSTIDSSQDKFKRSAKYINIYFIICLLCGLLSILFISIYFSINVKTFWLPFGGGIIIMVSSIISGILLGFLFGIPKTEVAGADKYKANTNLEQISDWLTKILVGVTLTQLIRIPSELQNLSNYLSLSIGIGTQNSGFVGALIVFSLCTGFLYGYIMTRTYFVDFLKSFDNIKDYLKEQVKENVQKEVESKIDSINSMWRSLYEKDGYKKTIEFADNYIEEHGEPLDDAGFWINLASAFGQKFKIENDSESKKRALEAVSKVLDTKKGWAIKRIKFLWNPDKHKDSIDDDLAVFYEDPDFIYLLGEK